MSRHELALLALHKSGESGSIDGRCRRCGRRFGHSVDPSGHGAAVGAESLAGATGSGLGELSGLADGGASEGPAESDEPGPPDGAPLAGGELPAELPGEALARGPGVG